MVKDATLAECMGTYRASRPQLVPALSGRSKCQFCGELIEFGDIRVGMPAKHNGVSITKWLHPPCFARHGLRCDYAPTDRAHCSGDGSHIRKGEPRLVMFLDSCDAVSGRPLTCHQKLYKPPNAASFIRELLALPNVDVRIDTIAGLDALNTPAHRTWVESALAGAAVGPPPVLGCRDLAAVPALAADRQLSLPPAQSASVTADPLFLDGCTIRVMWPQRRKGRVRERRGRIFYRPIQSRRKTRNTYTLMTQRRRGGGLRERRTSWEALRSRWFEVVHSAREAPHRWSQLEVAAACTRREKGESVQSVALALGRSSLALESKLRASSSTHGPAARMRPSLK